jgi:hypothetical protein
MRHEEKIIHKAPLPGGARGGFKNNQQPATNK